MLEDISPENWLTCEVYAHYGLALYAAQVLEHGIINLVLYTGVHDGSDVRDETRVVCERFPESQGRP